MFTKKLSGKRIAILAADGFEKVELTLPKTALTAQGALVEIVSLHKGKIRGMNLHKPASTVKVDKLISDISPDNYDGIFIPGGYFNPDFLRQSEVTRRFIKAFDDSEKPIASICHGPWVLASAGILRERTVTSWPGIRDDMVNAGARWLNNNVVTDGNLVTSRGPQDLPFFIPAMIELFETGKLAEQMNVYPSDEPASEPSVLVQQTISWVSGFPYKYAAGAAIIGLGIYGVAAKKGLFGSQTA